MKILLIEDNPGDAGLVREWLWKTDTPFDLISTDRLSTGLARLAEGGVDVLLLDLMLPDSRGLETLARVRAQGPEVPIVALTGLRDEALAVQAMQAGAQDYLVKGQVDARVLLRTIRYAIARQQIWAELRNLATIDELTGLYNRRGFMSLAKQLLKLAQRTEKGAFLLFADLDGMKQINDSFGHQEGDRALIKTAEILRGTFRSADVMARLGGDEFAVLAIAHSDETPKIMTARLQQRLRDYNGAKEDRGYTLSLSVGVTHFNGRAGLSLEEMMAQADEALYEHKRSRRKSPGHAA